MDPLSPGAVQSGTLSVLIDDCEDQNRMTSQGPQLFWEARSDRQILLQGDSTLLPTDEDVPYMSPGGMNSNFSFRAFGILRHDLFPGENPPNVFYGFIKVSVDVWADPTNHSKLEFALKTDPTPGFSPTLIIGIQTKDSDFFTWREVLSSGGVPTWEIRTLEFLEAQSDPTNFHPSLQSGASVVWPGPEKADITRITWTLYSEGPTRFSFGPTPADFFAYGINLDDIRLK